MIWAYLRAHAGGPPTAGYGCPVSVVVPGKGRVTMVYQFQGGKGGQQCAVVDLASGQALAWIEERHTGYPEQRAQAAINERMARVPRRFARTENHEAHIASTIDQAPAINTAPSVVGVMQRPGSKP